jgi:glutamyl-tRNA(Gln) amidotransferase subunit E
LSGVKVGIEIHQQLDTCCKLFCSCPTVLRDDEPHFSVFRRLKATTSEMGSIDRAALFESEKGKSFAYQGYVESTCLVELDEEPPHSTNMDAINVALTVAKMLNMIPVDEIHMMRKIVIDGSNTSGFQRTAKIAYDGWLSDGEERIGIQSLCLEEDAARKISEKGDVITYRLDRLGIPLVEIATGPDIHSGDQAERVAYSIGRALKATGIIKRGLGTIRQDLNISVEGGTRVEVKGVQELGLISEVVDYEAARQRGLIAIREELLKRGASSIKPDFVEITELFSSCCSKVIKKSLEQGGKVYAILLPRYRDLLKRELQPGRRFGTELSDRAKVYGGVGGIFHTDELPAYGLTDEDVEALRQKMEAKEDDCVVFVAADPSVCRTALVAVADRASQALAGVPAEVRAANEDATTRFMRPMPGSARMYPETDVPSKVVDRKMLEAVEKNLPEPLEAKTQRYIKEFGLSRDLAALIVDSSQSATFERLVREDGLNASFVASTFEYTLKMLRREGVDVDSIGPVQTREALLRVQKGDVAKEAVPDVFRWLAANREKSVGDAFSALNLGRTDIDSLKAEVTDLVERNLDLVKADGERATSRLMGDLMKKYRGKIDGKVLHDALQAEVLRRLGGSR